MQQLKLALVVDDDRISRNLVSIVLKKLGWLVDEAENGPQALQLITQSDYQLVLLDLQMHGLSGEETCRRIRSVPKFRTIKIIAYTAHAFSDDFPRILTAGFDDILTKPVSIQKFADTIVVLEQDK